MTIERTFYYVLLLRDELFILPSEKTCHCPHQNICHAVRFGLLSLRRSYFETFVQEYDDRFSRQYGFWRPYIEKVIYRYLDCGDLPPSCRVKCKDCGHEYLLAFSCKRRHFCPSCHQKRVVEFGEWLCMDVLKCLTGILFSASRRSFAVIFFTTESFLPVSAVVPGNP